MCSVSHACGWLSLGCMLTCIQTPAEGETNLGGPTREWEKMKKKSKQRQGKSEGLGFSSVISCLLVGNQGCAFGPDLPLRLQTSGYSYLSSALRFGHTTNPTSSFDQVHFHLHDEKKRETRKQAAELQRICRTIACPKIAGVVPSTGSTRTLLSRQRQDKLIDGQESRPHSQASAR